MLPYCHGPALCSGCWEELASKSLVHGDECLEGAQAAQRHADAIEAQLDAGDSLPVTAWGDEHHLVPKHHVGVLYRGRTDDTYRLIHKDEWPFRAPLSAVRYPEEWVDHP
jgi:hypothetical protein